MVYPRCGGPPLRARRPAPVLSLLLLLLLAAAGCIQEFDLGVGAFEVGPRSAILWTHVVPAGPKPPLVRLTLEVATSPDFERLVKRRSVTAKADDDYTVRARVGGLAPATRYYYRFTGREAGFGAVESSSGSFRTAPDRGDGSPVRFVVSGDSNLGFTGPRGLDFFVLSGAAADDPDFFVYFGDTIYADSGVLPGGADAFTLEEYRQVHRLTRADPHLKTLLGSTGTFSGWDDHEIRNDYAGETVDPVQFAAGARAFFEYLPVRAFPSPARPPYRTDRQVRWGRHVELFFLDGRQFRSAEQFCNETLPDGPETSDTLFSPFEEDEVIAAQFLPGPVLALAAPLLTPSDPECVEALLADPGRTYLGVDQLERLKHALLASDASFKIIINNTPLATLLFLPYDRWEGYLAERAELVSFITQHLDPDRVLVLTTDFHTNLALRLPGFTELIVGPIGQNTFAAAVLAQLPPEAALLGDLVLEQIEELIDRANGGGVLLGSEPDAFAYGLIEVFEDEGGEPRLRATARGDPQFADGANDPARVVDLFSFEMP